MSNENFWSGSPKTMFSMGLILGIAIAAVLALIILLTGVGGGRTFGGGVNLANNPSPAAAPQPNDQPSPAPAAQPVRPVDEKIDHIIGAKKAKVTLIEYSDFECPFCKRHLPSIQQALKDFSQDVRVVYRHFPLNSIHPLAQKAAEGSECAAKLGGNDAFWKMHDKIFEKSPDIGSDVLVSLASEMGLDQAKFKSCLDSGEMRTRVDADAATGEEAGVQGTPATFVNGKLIGGAVPYTALKAAITDAGAKN
ncbi:MAG: DsbA family protein [Candidatus Uhrbacteria bacterium]|nr:DsbA family protein [Candidatus Uhrbacteria bacterium]